MERRLLMWRVLLAIGCAGCLPSPEFRCDDNADCGPGGRCELVGYCSFADTGCPGSMQRFSEGAGPLAGDCVGTTDPPTSCPVGYQLLAMGTPGHRYRRIDSAEWMAQVNDCDGDSTTNPVYLAVPDTVGELAAIVNLNGGNKSWLGISDRMTEGAWVDVNGMTPSFLPWKPGAPELGAGNEKDCVVADSQSQIIDDACTAKYEAACECEE